MVGDEAGYSSQLDAAKERILTAHANAAANRAILANALTAWYPHWAVATARRIVEDQHETTMENPNRARTFRDVVLETDWSGPVRETMTSSSWDTVSDADLETDRIVRMRLMFRRTREGEVPEWLELALDRLTDAFVEIACAHGYVPMLYEMAPQPAGKRAKTLPPEVMVAAGGFEAAMTELAEAHGNRRAIRSARSQALAATVWDAS